MSKQRTLGGEASYSGIGLHTGEEVSITLRPAGEGSGIRFRRIDLPENPEVPATVEYVQDTSRSTNIGIGNVRVNTVEHLLAALKACQVDNALIDITAAEPPIGDGSSNPFIAMIEEVGVVELDTQLTPVSLKHPVYYSCGDIHLVALPSDEYRISYTLHYPKTAVIKSQYYSGVVSKDRFIKDLAPCRTFALYEEISYLMDNGLIKGGSLDNAVVIMNDVVLSKEGLRFDDEMVRHKVLDLIGDLSLVGIPFNAHIIAICSGHHSNVELAKKIYSQITTEVT